MSAIKNEIEKREIESISALKKSLNDDYSTKLFISHHLTEINSEYWIEHLGCAKPNSIDIINILVLKEHWGGDADIDIFDFTLPDNVTDYVLSVSFDDSGKINEISMDS
jgi:hypothetical protein